MTTGERSPRRAIIYCRVSSPNQEDMYGLDFQERESVASCKAKGDRILDIYREIHTGYDLEERKILGEIRRRLYAREFDVLVVWKFDRLSREQTHQAVLLYEFERYGAVVESVTEEFEDTAIGKFMRQAAAFAAELEREKIKQRSRAGQEERVAKGKPLTGRKPPYGYDYNENKTGYVENPEQAAIVRRIFTDLASGISLRGACRALYSEGIPSPSGKLHWDKSTIMRFLENPMYYGEPAAFRFHHYKERRTDPLTGLTRTVLVQKRLSADEMIPLPATVAPSLATKEVVERALANIAANNVVVPRGYDPQAFLLRGFIRCGHCDTPMAARTRKNQRFRQQYRCTADITAPGKCMNVHIERHQLDDAVWAYVLELLQRPEVILERVRAMQAEQGDPTASRREALEAQLKEIERQQNKLANAVATLEDEEASVPLLAGLKSLAQQAKEVRLQLERVTQEQEGWETVQAGVQRFLAWCEDVREYKELSYDDKRLILYILGLQVTVYKYGHEPRFEITMHPFNQAAEKENMLLNGDMQTFMSPGSSTSSG